MAIVTAGSGFISYKMSIERGFCEGAASSPELTITTEQKDLVNKLGTQFIKETVEAEEKEGTEEWEKEKSGCSFCQHFLQSPCKTQFMRWSKCVDKSKDLGMDYVNTCAVYTDALMSCTSDNDEYFALKQKEMEAEKGTDPDQ